MERERLLVGALASIHFVQHVFRILPPLVPVLALDLPYPLWKLGALVGVYYLGSGLGQTPAGVLADRYDRRLVLPPAVGLMGLGYLAFAAVPLLDLPTASGAPFSTGFVLMGGAVLVAGVGASAIHPTGYPLITANVTERKGRALGVWGSAAKLGDAAAPAAVAVLVLAVPWVGIFLVFGLAGVAYAVALFSFLSLDWVESRPAAGAAGRPDGAVSRADGAADHPGDEDASADPGETADRRRYRYPMAALLAFFAARAISEKGVKAFLPAFVVGVYGYSVAVAGVSVAPESFANLYFSAVFLVAAVVQLLVGRLVDAYDGRAVLVALSGASAAVLLVLAVVGLSALSLLLVLAAFGATFWGWAPARDALVSEIAPPDREGRTFGYLMTASHLLGAVAPVAVGFLAGVAGLRAGFAAMAFVTLAGAAAIASLFSARVYRPPDAVDAAD